MFQLVAYAPDGVRRFPVLADELVIGSEPQCDVHLPYSGVAGRHARVLRAGEGLRIQDLGSRKGILVSGERVREAALEILDEIRLGTVTLLLEDVLPRRPEGRKARPRREPVAEMDAGAMVRHLARISDWVLADAESRTPLETLVSDLLRRFGQGVLFLFQGALDDCGIKFVVAGEASWLACADEILAQMRAELKFGADEVDDAAFLGTLDGEEAWVCCHRYRALDRSYFLVTLLPRFRPGEWSPAEGLRAVGDLLILGLVHHVGHYEPILPGRQVRQNLLLDPSFVVGESATMVELLDQLKAAVDPPVQVLLQGEPGSGRTLLARSLHISGPRRHGPFVVASGEGAGIDQLEADLFGAEVPGREGPVRRQGKLLLADGGTLYLADVEKLPIPLQGRLMRFFRSGRVEPAGSREGEESSVRIIASSAESLDILVATDRMRVDLAHRLSQLTLTVPSLRQRREELPLLIQTQINRFCHEIGKRVQGIAVKAMNALLSYDFPGNLPELENITRQLVHLCPSGKPIDFNLLPDRVRTSPILSAVRVEKASDLNLENLTQAWERAALREALRRSRGNKSQAARELGLSRNGLAMKIARLGLDA
jgi:DNA-binding NtrC family response regulator